MLHIEDVYRSNQATYNKDTKAYEFKFNYQWSQTPNQKSISVREVRLITAPRRLFFDTLTMMNSSTNKSANVSVDIILPSNKTLSDAQTLFNEYIKELYTQYITADSSFTNLNNFIINYDPSTTTLSIGIGVTDTNLYLVLNSADVSNDFKNIVGITNNEFYEDLEKYSNMDPLMWNLVPSTTKSFFETKYSTLPFQIIHNSVMERRIKVIKFNNVWSRDQLMIKSSFVDLAYDGYLGFTNTIFNPPKKYPIKFNSYNFYMYLYDGYTSKPISLPEDGKDNFIVEVIYHTF